MTLDRNKFFILYQKITDIWVTRGASHLDNIYSIRPLNNEWCLAMAFLLLYIRKGMDCYFTTTTQAPPQLKPLGVSTILLHTSSTVYYNQRWWWWRQVVVVLRSIAIKNNGVSVTTKLKNINYFS